jgi:hypothetical protein
MRPLAVLVLYRKPTLAYKLSTANQKSLTINLRTDNNWEGLITDMKAKMITKKDLIVVISVFPNNLSPPNRHFLHSNVKLVHVIAAHNDKEARIHPQLSSDPPKEDLSYPSIIDFVAMFIRVVPQQAELRTVGETLDSLHFYQINEIASLMVDDLGTERFRFFVPGNATYLLDRVRKEVKRLDNAARCAHRS